MSSQGDSLRGRLLTACLRLFLVAPAVLPVGCVFLSTQHDHRFTVPTPLAPNHVLILGFMGGLDRWDDATRGVRKLALRLRSTQLPGVHVETVENAKRELAITLIRHALDRNGDNHLEPHERSSARLVLYGKSFGGAAVIKMARELAKMDVPVLLTVQVDSVGVGDATVPPNVQRAANLFQADGFFIRGEPKIQAQDPRRTQILGNFEFGYRDRVIDLSDVPWHKKVFRVAHAKMDADPVVWQKVEALILDVIAQAARP